MDFPGLEEILETLVLLGIQDLLAELDLQDQLERVVVQEI